MGMTVITSLQSLQLAINQGVPPGQENLGQDQSHLVLALDRDHLPPMQGLAQGPSQDLGHLQGNQDLRLQLDLKMEALGMPQDPALALDLHLPLELRQVLEQHLVLELPQVLEDRDRAPGPSQVQELAQLQDQSLVIDHIQDHGQDRAPSPDLALDPTQVQDNLAQGQDQVSNPNRDLDHALVVQDLCPGLGQGLNQAQGPGRAHLLGVVGHQDQDLNLGLEVPLRLRKGDLLLTVNQIQRELNRKRVALRKVAMLKVKVEVHLMVKVVLKGRSRGGKRSNRKH